MTQHDDPLYLGHMLVMAKEGQGIAARFTRKWFDSGVVLQLALTRVVEVIDEAARRVSPTGRAQLGSLPWEKITGMRHRLVHDYTNVDLNRVWRTVVDDLPVLIEELSKVIPPEPPD